ncbi:5-dehydro-4-deoxyglucarate dehydratase [Telmatospirillum sp. J64-1]|uniref:5-dehydro-4-deoxyglucarate dehydratase n=1 Tax=Telmatospirillum sp. J64-1 TaxID=2502183 RepID=UPI00115F402D|nr:5-dehydro-4-deoxyglucarate dehydratase [Telmatospirillum sp. J64-1]
MAASYAPTELRDAIASGLLSFPLTDFDENDRFNEGAFQSRVEWMSKLGTAAIFPAGGAGEFFSLTAAEYSAVIRAAVEVKPSIPVIAATGYGTRMAVEFAAEAEKLGADGLLLLPPYLTESSQEGLYEHIRAICSQTRLGVIIYNRANCRIKVETLARLVDSCPNLIGFKDGVGDIEEILKIRSMLGSRLLCVNGMPTAEVYAQAYMGMGISTYTSAIYNFVPKSAMMFHRAILAADHVAVAQFTRDFLAPYSRIRARQPGYAVSIVKAGVDIVGRSAGKVRAPLSNLSSREYEELSDLISQLGPQE